MRYLLIIFCLIPPLTYAEEDCDCISLIEKIISAPSPDDIAVRNELSTSLDVEDQVLRDAIIDAAVELSCTATEQGVSEFSKRLNDALESVEISDELSGTVARLVEKACSKTPDVGRQAT